MLRSQKCQTVLTEMLCSYPVKFNLCRIVKYIAHVMNITLFFFCCHKYSRETVDVFPDLTKSLSLGLSWTLFKQSFSNLALL